MLGTKPRASPTIRPLIFPKDRASLFSILVQKNILALSSWVALTSQGALERQVAKQFSRTPLSYPSSHVETGHGNMDNSEATKLDKFCTGANVVNMTILTSLSNPRQISAQEIHKACPLVPPSPAEGVLPTFQPSASPPSSQKTGKEVTVTRVTAPVLHSTPRWPSSRQELCRKTRNLVAPSSSDSLPRVQQKEHACSPVSITNHNRAVTTHLEASRAQHRQWVPITGCRAH